VTGKCHQAKLGKSWIIASIDHLQEGAGVYLNVNFLAGTFYFLGRRGGQPAAAFSHAEAQSQALGRAILVRDLVEETK